MLLLSVCARVEKQYKKKNEIAHKQTQNQNKSASCFALASCKRKISRADFYRHDYVACAHLSQCVIERVKHAASTLVTLSKYVLSVVVVIIFFITFFSTIFTDLWCMYIQTHMCKIIMRAFSYLAISCHVIISIFAISFVFTWTSLLRFLHRYFSLQFPMTFDTYNYGSFKHECVHLPFVFYFHICL